MAEKVHEKMVAKYKCSECGKKWKSVNSSGSPKQCISCKGPSIPPYKMRPAKEKDKKEKRKYGKYNCTCGNNWPSSYTWVGKWQKCKVCGEKVMPHDIQPLRPSYGTHKVTKPHQSALCQKCIELGYNCRGYVPPANSEVDIPDDQSVISESSTISTIGEDQQLSDGDLTPVASDDEDRLLESKMSELNIK